MMVESGRVRKVGNSWVVVLPPRVRAAMGVMEGDRFAMRPKGRFLVMELVPLQAMCRLDAEEVVGEEVK